MWISFLNATAATARRPQRGEQKAEEQSWTGKTKDAVDEPQQRRIAKSAKAKQSERPQEAPKVRGFPARVEGLPEAWVQAEIKSGLKGRDPTPGIPFLSLYIRVHLSPFPS